MKSLVFCVALAAGAAAAHPGHDDELRPQVSETAVRARVDAEVRDLADAKKIDASWAKVPLKRVERVSRSGTPLWMALYENPKQKTDRELYLFVTLYGDVVDGGFAMDATTATERAKKEIDRLVALKKVAPSWQTASAPKLEKRDVGNSWEWVAVVDNAADVEHPRLWIFLKPWGDFVAANHTGK